MLVLGPTAVSLLLLEMKSNSPDLSVQVQGGKGTEVLEVVLEQLRI